MPITNDIEAAVCRLRAGGLVAFPTETVYGLGADAANPAAVRRIFAVKGRPPDHPLIIHIGDAAMMPAWVREIPHVALRLAERFWPGPLTLILKRGQAPLEVTGGQDSVGLRVPGHPVALELLRRFGGGIAAPSANRFGRVSPTRAEHVLDEFGESVDLILAGGDCRVGLESSILSLVGERPVLLRPGAIAASELEAVIGAPLAGQPITSDVRAPGMLESHYAPDTRLLLCRPEQLAATSRELTAHGLRIAVMTRTLSTDELPAGPHPHPMPADAPEYGRQLYASLRRLDDADLDIILVEQPPDEEAWQAVNDRLGRASHPIQQGKD
jgi:L-threonylcarbamoyladenylate synthase